MAKTISAILSFTINAPLDPYARGEHFEDPLYDWLQGNGAKILDGGGGTMLRKDGVAVSDFYVEFTGRSHIRGAIQFVKSLGVPIGSTYRIGDEDEIPFGDCRCVDFSVNKAPKFGSKRLQSLFAAVKNAVQSTGRLLAAHETNGRLVFHVYGNDPAAIQSSMGQLLKAYSKHDPRIETAE